VIGPIVRQLVGLFVDDGLLAVGILVAVAATASLTLLRALPTWAAGLLLAVALPAALAASVLMSVRRARRPGREGEPPTPS
jgi:Ca2+/H+ antiporter, TMEM165/GDT1 family